MIQGLRAPSLVHGLQRPFFDELTSFIAGTAELRYGRPPGEPKGYRDVPTLRI